MKKCTKCGQTKDTNHFPKNRLTSDGLGSWCKACVSQNSAAYFKTARGKETHKRYFASKKGKAALERAFRKLQKEGYFRYGKGGFLTLRLGAVKRGVTFSITEPDLESWWIETHPIVVATVV